MANQGLQFEHAVMYVAMSRILDRNNEQEVEFNSAAKQWSSIPQNIKDTAEKIVLDMAPSTEPQRQNYFKSFKKMSENGDDKLIVNDIFKDEDLEEWN